MGAKTLASLESGRPTLIGEVREIFMKQSEAIASLADRLDTSFPRAVELILAGSGHLVVCGMGKSGLVGRKLAATFASTGTPSFFVHPAEAYHGDLGMITEDDAVILISYSGETEEVVRLVPHLKHRNIPLIALVGSLESTLARQADVAIDISVESEICPLNLAPTSSTLAILAMGDALAISLMRARAFRPVDFARFHPGGSLGKRLGVRVRDVMRVRNLPLVKADHSVSDTMLTIARGRCGMAIAVDGEARLLGIIAAGDLRRVFGQRENLLEMTASAIMNSSPVTIAEDAMLIDAETRMRQLRLKGLVVLDAERHVVGILNAHDE